MNVPWKKIIKFHREIISLSAEKSFSLNMQGRGSKDWGILDHELGDLSGPWQITDEDLSNQEFVHNCRIEKYEEWFIGTGCITRTIRGNIDIQPLFIREARLSEDGDGRWNLTPISGKWVLSPATFNLLDRLRVETAPLDEDLGKKLVEIAVTRSNRSNMPVEHLLVDLVGEEFLEISDHLVASDIRSVLIGKTNQVNNWDVNLVHDYDRLNRHLERNSSDIGGLEVLSGLGDVEESIVRDPKEFIPLNESQRDAVKRLMGEQHVSVISGPPGCGKSQVVVATLLNAWAEGIKVLFASNNNQAVDVVLEKLQHFESEYPIVVRAGSKNKQRVIETIGKALTMVERFNRNSETPSADLHALSKLQEEKTKLQEILDSQIPAQIDQQFKSALNAHAKVYETIDKKENEKATLIEEYKGAPFAEVPIEESANLSEQLNTWIRKVPLYRNKIAEDFARRSTLQTEKEGYEHDRENACLFLGFEEFTNWDLFQDVDSIERYEKWIGLFRDLLDEPIEDYLQPYEWDQAFEVWASSKEARDWGNQANEYASRLKKLPMELNRVNNRIQTANQELEDQRQRLIELGFPKDVKADLSILEAWAESYKQYVEYEENWLKWIPKTFAWIARRQYKTDQNRVRKLIPAHVWQQLMNSETNAAEALSPIVEELRIFAIFHDKWAELKDERTSYQKMIREIALEALALGEEFPESSIKTDPNELIVLAERFFSKSDLAQKASHAHEKREKQESAIERIQVVVKQIIQIKRANAICAGFMEMEGHGRTFFDNLERLFEEMSSEAASAVRKVHQLNSVNVLYDNWKSAIESHSCVQSLESQMSEIPTPDDRLSEWWAERPQSSHWLLERPEDFPTQESKILQDINSLSLWCDKWEKFRSEILPVYEQTIDEEHDWATNALTSAIETALNEDLPDETQAEFKNLYEKHSQPERVGVAWDIEELQGAFGSFEPRRIEAHIERIEKKIEGLSFNEAKQQWLERCASNPDALGALSRLKAALPRNNLRITEDEYDLFQKSLEILPIWVVTGQSAQSIPLVAGGFDLILIDEASQCTLTNLLPLLFRGKRVGIIGDSNQLNAIPSIPANMERSIAQKYEIKDFEVQFGHAENDVYKMGVASLPNREGDVLNLVEHYRSHPLIIGFSNKHIYQKALTLRREPFMAEMSDYQPGIYVEEITGDVERHGGSWVNRVEAEEVIKIVQSLREQSKGRSIGVVTPFRPQRELLEELCLSSNLSNVEINTVYGFQGGERDIIVFSPVVAPGIPKGTLAWVGNPNQVNVMITRAREVFILAGQAQWTSRNSGGLLGDLAKYCIEVHDLQKTSPAEAYLYSFLLLDGIFPEIHPIINDMEVDFRINDLIIEVDGSQHEHSQAEDHARDAALSGLGYHVLRFSAREVMETVSVVVNKIKTALENNL